MNIGLLWYDNDKITLHEKIAKAMAYYQNKYGRLPTLAIVNPKDFEECNNITVGTSKSIRINHIWLGIGESND